jgi:hypothetical protein
VVGHWNGRAIWQLREASRLVLAWRVCESGDEARALMQSTLEEFTQAHGRLPFANRSDDTVEDDRDE